MLWDLQRPRSKQLLQFCQTVQILDPTIDLRDGQSQHEYPVLEQPGGMKYVKCLDKIKMSNHGRNIILKAYLGCKGL